MTLHGLEFSIDGSGSDAGPFLEAGGVAVHQGTGDLYVIDRGRNVVDKFDANGSPQDFSALSSSSLDVEACPNFRFASAESGGNSGEEAIAVDSSGGPHDGTIYVSNPSAPSGATPQTCAFDSTGNFLWTSENTGYGFAIPASGNLWMANFGGAYEYVNTGSGLELENIVGTPHFPLRIALDSSQNIYLHEYYLSRVARYTFAGGFQNTIQPGPSFPQIALAVDPSSQALFVAASGTVNEYVANGTQLVSQTGEEILSNVQGLAVRGGRIYASDSTSDKIFVFGPLEEFAKVTTGQAEGVRRTTATVTGGIDPDGAGNVTGCHVEYGLDKGYGNSTPCNEATPYSVPGDVSADLTGLTPGTTYHYRMFATNSAGTNRGIDRTFTTPYVSGVETASASQVDRTSATLHGNLDPDGLGTTYYFEWGLTIGYGYTNPVPPPGQSVGSAPGNTPVEAEITGLDPDTTYHYRLVAVNADGTTHGKDQAVTTDPPIKGLSTGNPTEVGPDTATMSGTLDPDGFDTTYYFEWGPTTAYGNISPLPGADAGSSPGSIPVSAVISGLDHYTAYHYRLVATNSFGTTTGQDVEFQSALPFLPTISDTSLVGVTDTGATVAAKINPGFGPTVYRFQYGKDTSYGSRTALSEPIGDDGAEHLVTADIENLQPGTTYHYRAVGINFSGSTLGPDRTFVTADFPEVAVVSASDIGTTTARLHAVVNPNASPTTYRFEYGPTDSYGLSTPESSSIGSGTTNHSVANDVAGLAPGTVYHYRVLATNAIGTVTAFDQTFKTAALPSTGSPKKVRRCKRGLVRRRGKCVKRRSKPNAYRGNRGKRSKPRNGRNG